MYNVQLLHFIYKKTAELRNAVRLFFWFKKKTYLCRRRDMVLPNKFCNFYQIIKKQYGPILSIFR
jgi:hypothetical protein